MRNAGPGSWPERRLRISSDRDAIWFEGATVFSTDVRVVRPDGTEAGVDEVGEIAVQGLTVMAGHRNDPERTAAVLQDGWYRTGDAGSVDDDGFLYVRDRYKEEVLEAAVIGFPDPQWGEVGMAVVVAAADVDPDPEQPRLRLRSRLAAVKVPRYVEFVDELPRTATGKVRKPDLRAQSVTTEETPA